MNAIEQQITSAIKAAGGEIITDETAQAFLSQCENLLDLTLPEICTKYSSDTPLDLLAQIEHVLLPARFGVAENGALWLEDDDLPHRIIPFITQHLILKLPLTEILPTMHEAYRRISGTTTGFGVFISGPSKTADIEQSLVYGAHGARTLTVWLSA